MERSGCLIEKEFRISFTIRACALGLFANYFSQLHYSIVSSDTPVSCKALFTNQREYARRVMKWQVLHLISIVSSVAMQLVETRAFAMRSANQSTNRRKGVSRCCLLYS